MNLFSNLARLFQKPVDDPMGSKGPLVSVIVPTYCRPEMLKDAVQSILDQTFPNFEIIVVNDGGPDVSGMLASLGSPEKIVYIRHEKTMDRSSARNTGLAAARGKYIGYLDDDDIFYPDHLEKLLRTLQRTGLKVAYSDTYQAFQTRRDGRYVVRKRKRFPAREFDAEQMLIANYIPTLCIMHEKSCLEATGIFDTSLSTHEDWDLWIRFAHHFQFAHLKSITCEFRSRDDQSNTTTAHRADFLRTAELIYQRYADYAKGSIRVADGQREFLRNLRAELQAAKA